MKSGGAQKVLILPAHGCRRSRRIMAYLEAKGIPFQRIPLESPEGQALATKYQMRASPGVLVDGTSINPYDLLIRGQCRVDEAKTSELLGVVEL